MDAGRELDALIADRVFGLKQVQVINGVTVHVEQHGNMAAVIDVSHYSTDIAAAWEVVEKIRQIKYWENFTIVALADNKFAATTLMGFVGGDLTSQNLFHEDGRMDPDLVADTAPHAICLAALKAIK